MAMGQHFATGMLQFIRSAFLTLLLCCLGPSHDSETALPSLLKHSTRDWACCLSDPETLPLPCSRSSRCASSKEPGRFIPRRRN